jgi:ABC-type amino acid transport substrate-binding protein
MRGMRPLWRQPAPWLALLVLLALAVWLGPGAVRRILQRDAVWERIQRERVLRVGMDASYPPFEVVDQQGRFSGLDVDLAQALATRWGVQVRFVVVHFDGLYDALKSDKFDIILSALPYDRTQTRDLRYSQSYFNAGQVLLAREDDLALRSVSDLAGKKVAVELGSEAHQLARTLARDQGIAVEIVTRREMGEVAALLRSGEVAAILCDRVTAYGLMHPPAGAAQAAPLRLVGPSLSSAPYVLAARPEAQELIRQVNAALDEWQRSGFLDELQRRWF